MQAEGVDYQRLPLGCFFCYFFLRAEDCAEDFIQLNTRSQTTKAEFYYLKHIQYHLLQ